MLSEVYQTILASEEFCLEFLYNHQVLSNNSIQDPGKHGKTCGSEVMIRIRTGKQGKKYPEYRCTIKKCRVRRSVGRGDKFFTWRDTLSRTNCKLSLCSIVELIYLWTSTKMTVEQLARETNFALRTKFDRPALMSEVPTIVVDSQQKYEGTHSHPVEIDESIFHGRCKYGKGRNLLCDAVTRNESEVRESERLSNPIAHCDIFDENVTDTYANVSGHLGFLYLPG